MELINILIRTSNRPEKFKRCLRSITSQSYPNIRIIVSVDKPCDYVPSQLETIQVTANRQLSYFYDEYCNNLKSQVTDGWFLFLDDDDYLIPDCLSKLDLSHHAIIVKLQRAGNIVPKDKNIRRGQIGMPCLVLHHSLKHIANIPGNGQGDYFWIKSVSEQVELSWQDIIMVGSDGRGLGR